MTTEIGPVTLTRDMYWSDEFKYKLVNASVEDTLGGGINFQEFSALERGRLITLESTETQGLQLRSIVAALKAIADIAGATYTLTISSNNQTVTKTVRFRNELDGGPVVFEPIQPREGLHSNTVYYKGSIFLMVV